MLQHLDRTCGKVATEFDTFVFMIAIFLPVEQSQL